MVIESYYAILDVIVFNIINTCAGVLIFVMAYVSNMFFGVWYNTTLLGQNFDGSRLIKSLLKIVCVGFGILLLTMSISVILPFAKLIGFPIPTEYIQIVQALAIIGVCLKAALKYIKESFDKMTRILTGSKK